MPTRSRVRAKSAPAAEQEEFFDPNKVVYATANPDPEDDGTIDTQPIEEGEGFYDTQSDPELLPDEENKPDDPSDSTPLGKTTAGLSQGQQAAQAELRDFMRRMNNLLGERDQVDEDIKELKKEMKGRGYDMPAVSLVVKLDRLTETQKAKRKTQNGINATYANAAGIDEELL